MHRILAVFFVQIPLINAAIAGMPDFPDPETMGRGSKWVLIVIAVGWAIALMRKK